MKQRLTRRRLLQQISSFCVALSCRPVMALGYTGKDNTPTLLARLSGIYDDTTSAAVIGMAYLEEFEEEANAQRLVELICPDARQQNRFLRANLTELRKLLDYQVRLDFAVGNTVRLRGWVLARTEVRLYAIAAIISV